MKTIVDLKKRMIIGSKWHCFNHFFKIDLGIGKVSKVTQKRVYFLREKRGEKFETWFSWPKKKQIIIEGEQFHLYSKVMKKLVLTYTKK